MTEKEWRIIGEEFISYTGGCAILITDGDCQFHLWETRKDAQKVCNKLNELAEENEQLKQSNKDAWNLIRFIYNEIKEDGSMDWWRIQDLVEFEE